MNIHDNTKSRLNARIATIVFTIALLAINHPTLWGGVGRGLPLRYGTTYTLDRATLLDKIKGGWAGQTIGCTYGGPTEFKYKGGIIPAEEPIPWYDAYCKDIFEEDPGLYDDVYMDLTVLQVMQRYGLNAPASAYANSFAHADYKLWHANQAMRYNVLHGIMPPASGHWTHNPHADDIDFQIESDFIGMICPGMPNVASAFADTVGHVMNYGDGWYGGVFTAAMYTLAFVCDDIPTVVSEALRTIPEGTGFHNIIKDVLDFWRQHPDDWTECWLLVQKRYGFEKGCPEGVFNGFNIDAKMNAAFCVIGLLYGQGDFFRTMDIATRCGNDSDCNPATAAGILGVMHGWSAIPERFARGIDLCEDYNFPYTDISLSRVYGINLDILAQVVTANGGRVKGDKYTFKLQEPQAVGYEQSFEGCRPVERRVTKFCIDPERTFTFTGTGCVLMGNVREADSGGDTAYVARLEAYIDGQKVEDIDMPFDYITRKYDIFYRYNLPNGQHSLTVRWLNPDRHFAIQCGGFVVYGEEASNSLPIELEDMSVSSSVLGHNVAYSVILPPDYYSSSRRYPVVYMLHGIGGDHASWMEYGNVARLMHKMKAEGSVGDAIVVSPDGYQLYYSDTFDGQQRYELFFTTELLPAIDHRYRTVATREGRSIVGFSMGGFGALTLALRHPGLFSAVAALSASIRTDSQYVSEGPQKDWDYQWGRIFGAVGQEGTARLTPYYRARNPKDLVASMPIDSLRSLRIMLDIGDRDTHLLDPNMELHRLLTDRGVAHEWQIRPGGHDFQCWNAALPKALKMMLKPCRNSIPTSPSFGGGLGVASNPLSSRRYPVIYVTGDADGSFSDALAKTADSLALQADICPLMVCRVPVGDSLENAIKKVEEKCPAVRPGKRFRAVADATVAMPDPVAWLKKTDAVIHR